MSAFALFVLPKYMWGLTRLRPEDFTGALLLALLAVVSVTGRLRIPDSTLARVLTAYFVFFLGVLALRDIVEAHHIQAVIFWAKEASYVAFGYVAWQAYRESPESGFADLILMMLPNIAYGVYQALTGELKGIYGVAAFGHEQSPASSGMLYFGFAVITGFACLRRRSLPVLWVLWLLSAGLVLIAGSKIALVGLIAWTGFYLLEVAWERRDRRSLWIVAGFATTAAAAVALAIFADRLLGSTWGPLGRYQGLLQPFKVLARRGIWGKIEWLTSPLAWIIGAGYSPPHVAGGAPFSIGMAMDNQALYYLITGGFVGLVLYAVLIVTVYRLLPAHALEGKVIRALVVAYVFMGLGGEVLQLSVHGNIFWLVVGLCLASYPKRHELSSA